MGRRGEQMTELGDEAPVVEASRAARARREQAEAALTGASEAIAIAEIRRKTAAEARDSAESEGASARAALAALESEAKALARAVESAGGNRAIQDRKSDVYGQRVSVSGGHGGRRSIQKTTNNRV